MDPIAYTITEFQRAHKIGHSKFYELKKEGLAPRVVEIGGKRVIFGEDAAAWRRRMAELSAAKSPEAAE
jgi:predicted DNA-binding transcriptional regulator AlpA